MDIESLNNLKRKSNEELFDLTKPNILFRDDLPMTEYIVKSGDEMRIDIIFQNMYNLEPNEVGLNLSNIDIILSINNIDNPLNINKGDVLLYPEFDKLDDFRRSDESIEEDRDSVKERLIMPNKSTRKDPDRKKFADNDFSLPPVVLRKSKAPVRIEGNNITFGGL